MSEDKSKKEKKEEKNKWHRFMAADCFNSAWNCMDMENRTPDDDELMISATFASKYHWSQIGEPINFQRAEWQISRIFSILGRGDLALQYAKHCLALTKEHDFKDFDLAFAHECMARSYATLGNKDDFSKYYQLAKESGEEISKKEDREYFFKDFKAGNWFGMK